MPIYVYKCSACGHVQEALQKISAAPLTQCEACGEPTLVKQVTAAGFELKGSGWYVTDFRGGDKNAGKGGAAVPAPVGGETAGAGAPAAASTPAASSSTAGSSSAGSSASPAPSPASSNTSS